MKRKRVWPFGRLSKRKTHEVEEMYRRLSEVFDPSSSSLCQVGVVAGVKLGFHAIFGTYREDDGHYGRHFWNKDPISRVIVDFAAKQYGDEKPIVITPDSPYYERYRQLRNFRNKVHLEQDGPLFMLRTD